MVVLSVLSFVILTVSVSFMQEKYFLPQSELLWVCTVMLIHSSQMKSRKKLARDIMARHLCCTNALLFINITGTDQKKQNCSAHSHAFGACKD